MNHLPQVDDERSVDRRRINPFTAIVKLHLQTTDRVLDDKRKNSSVAVFADGSVARRIPANFHLHVRFVAEHGIEITAVEV